jgi:cation:H+ antiporter
MRERALTHSSFIDIALIVVGIALLILGAEILVGSSVSIARQNGISETVIGLTLIAAGTSLPELVTSVVAAMRGNPDIAIGNIVGSNIYNVLAILGVASVLGPVEIDAQIRAVDMWVMLAATLALLPPLLLGNRMGRFYGLLLLVGYVAYVGYLFQKAGLLHLPVN